MNKVILIGNLGSEVDTRTSPNGVMVANLSLATTSFKKKDGEKVKKTEWHRVVFFGKAAENLVQYAKKGSKLSIEGELQTRKWQKDGVDHYTTEILGENFEFLGGNLKPDNSAQPVSTGATTNDGFDPFDDPAF